MALYEQKLSVHSPGIVNNSSPYNGYDMAPHIGIVLSQKKTRPNYKPHQPTLQERDKKTYELYRAFISSQTHEALIQILTDMHPPVSKIDDVVLANEWVSWIPNPCYTHSHRNEFL